MAHTALPGWQPSIVPALWLEDTGSGNEGGDIVKPVPTPDPKPQPGDTWDADKIYFGGETVVYNGQQFEARWWTQGNAPDATKAWGAWKAL